MDIRPPTSDLTIRPFLETDRPQLSELYLDGRVTAFYWLDTGCMCSKDFDRDTEGEAIWVAERDNRLLGFVSVWPAENFIHNLFVRPEAAGNGIGSALLRASLEHLGRPAALKCLSPNTRAPDFYLARGWCVAGEHASPQGRYLLMRLDIDDLPD